MNALNPEEVLSTLSRMETAAESIESLIGGAKVASAEAHEQAQRAQYAAQQAGEQLQSLQGNLRSLQDLIQQLKNAARQLEE